TARVTARYIAPVSRYAASRAAASRREAVDLPEPDGPSTATTHRCVNVPPSVVTRTRPIMPDVPDRQPRGAPGRRPRRARRRGSAGVRVGGGARRARPTPPAPPPPPRTGR